MNRKSIVFASILAVLLFGGIVVMFYSLFLKDDGAGTTDYVSLSGGISAVPSDAILFLDSERLSDISGLDDDGSALHDFLECIPDYSSDWEAVLSMHYSNKNTVSPLLVLTCPDTKTVSTLLPDILAKCRGVIEKRYDSFIIHKAAVPDISFTMYDRYLLASPSTVIVEASLRHIASGSSIAEVMPKGMAGVPDADALLQVNFANVGKLFSGTVTSQNLRYASFFQNFASWGAFGLESGDGVTAIDGRTYPDGKGGKFSEVLLTQRGRESDVYSVVPHSASFVLTVPINSVDGYLSAYSTYLAANGKKKDYDYILATLPAAKENGISPASLAKALEINELAVFSVNYGQEKTLLGIRAGKPSAVKVYSDTVSAYPYPGYIPALFGKAFAPSAEEAYFIAGDWLIVGGREEVESFFRSYRNPNFFSFDAYLSQTPASEEIRNITSAALVINAGKYHPVMASYFKAPYSKRLEDAFGDKNFEFVVLNARKVGNNLELRVACYREDLESLPSPKLKQPEGAATTVTDEAVVEIPSGPFEVIDFRDGSKNYLEQLSNNNIRLLNSSRRSIWTIPFDAPICGTVRQIDYLKNDKLQMLFGAGEKVYLFDRLGRSVGKFPVSLGKEILLGPDVYDFNGDKNYTMVVLHTDNTIAQYDLNGKKVSGWSDITLNEKIMSLPERIVAGGRSYWVVRTSYQTIVYDSQGVPVADFSKKRRLKKDSPVEVLSANELVVMTSDGRNMVLNLQDGTLRRK